MVAKRRIGFDFEEAEFLLHLVKRFELKERETTVTRGLVSKLRAARDVLATGQPEDTAEIAEQIFSAGAGEGGVPSASTFVRDGISFTRFFDGEVIKNCPRDLRRM